MFRSLFPYDMFGEMDRLQREIQQASSCLPTSAVSAAAAFPPST